VLYLDVVELEEVGDDLDVGDFGDVM